MEKFFKICKRTLSILTIFSFIFGALFSTLYYYYPGVIEHLYTSYAFYQAKLDLKTVDVEGVRVEYAEKGNGETILFIHGFQSDKRSWLPYIQSLNDRPYHQMIFDLPGHGGSSIPDSSMHFDLQSMADFVDQFVKTQGIKNFHLVGLSMGGGIAAVYSARYPEKVKSLILLNPFGVRTLAKSDLEQEIDRGHNPFFPTTVDELDALVVYIRGKPLSLSQLVKEYALSKVKEKQRFYQRVFSHLIHSKHLEYYLPGIRSKTLVLIGGEDRVLHPSSGETFKRLVPTAKVHLLPKAPHVFAEANFEEVIQAIRLFLEEDKEV